mgnify:CR=1 FL=1
MLLYGRQLLEAGHEPIFLLGGRSQRDLLELDRFAAFGRVFTTTEDATMGEKGFVTHHSIWKDEHFDCVAACGPKPMMQAVAKMARQYNTPCFVSLENLMACGVGACLCCVEKTVKGIFAFARKDRCSLRTNSLGNKEHLQMPKLTCT